MGDHLAHTLAAAREPYKTLFAVGSVMDARLSECLGLVWADVQLGDLDAAEVSASSTKSIAKGADSRSGPMSHGAP